MPVLKKITVLLIDGDSQIRRFLRAFLEKNNCLVLEAATGEAGMELAIQRSPDAVLMDLILPDTNGLDILKRLREWSQMPVLIVSAKGDEDTKIDALNRGADDFITKPFSPGEVLARMRAIQRRVPPISGSPPLFQSGPLEVDLVSRIVKVYGEEVNLTATEYSLVHFFVVHAGKVLTHAQILREIWGEDKVNKLAYLRVYMKSLREKLEPNCRTPRLFVTITRVGYRLVPAK